MYGEVQEGLCNVTNQPHTALTSAVCKLIDYPSSLMHIKVKSLTYSQFFMMLHFECILSSILASPGFLKQWFILSRSFLQTVLLGSFESCSMLGSISPRITEKEKNQQIIRT